MARTTSRMVRLGTKAPDFSLPDVVTGEARTLSSIRGAEGTLVIFMCRHCPYVKHIEEELGRIENDFRSLQIAIVGISANDAKTYPEDAPESLKAYVHEQGWSFPLLYDESQSTAKAYDASCTPDFFLYDANLQLFYRGQLDASRPGNEIPVTGESLREAAALLRKGETPPPDQLPSLGCNIKWKVGLEPEYFQER